MFYCLSGFPPGRVAQAQVKVNQSQPGAQNTTLSVAAAPGPEEEARALGAPGTLGIVVPAADALLHLTRHSKESVR